MPNQPSKIYLYDTTLRDGSQRRDISYSLNDKIRIAHLLDDFGMDYIEGGWPGSNPKDAEFFEHFKSNPLKNSRLVAFGSTRKISAKIEEDKQILSLLDAGTEVVTLVAKTSVLHVEQILQTTLAENLKMIADSVEFFHKHEREVILDAEHFFDAYQDNPEYALACLKVAEKAGANWLVLCDTNGGKLPDFISETVSQVKQNISINIGVHCHNDCELAVANSLAAVIAGATQIQGTVNGYGERCGNANLTSIIPTLQLKMNVNCLAKEKLPAISELSKQIAELANINLDPFAAYVGSAAFAHKGGIHVAAVEKTSASYEHIPPETVGNHRQVIVSDLSGRSNIRLRAENLGLKLEQDEVAILNHVKNLENQGLPLEGADGTFELAIRRMESDYQSPFELIETNVHSSSKHGNGFNNQASVKIRFKGEILHTIAESDGPVDALDKAIRKALEPVFPELKNVKLTDYKVRILDPKNAASATTRVWIEASDENNHWSTVGCSASIVEASSYALADSFELFILQNISNRRSQHGHQAA